MTKKKAPELSDRHQLLSRVNVFSQLSPLEIDLVLEVTTTRHLAARQVLFRKGDVANALYAVMSGRLRASAAGAEGKEVVFGYHDPGDVIGEVALLDSEPRSATIEAVEPSDLLMLHRRDFLPVLEKHPRVAISLASVLASRLRRLSEVMEDVRFLSLETRLAKKLLALADSYGRPMLYGVKIDLKLPQQELGELVGSSRESINKQLRAWSEQRLLKFDRGYITILDRAGLEAQARYSTL